MHTAYVAAAAYMAAAAEMAATAEMAAAAAEMATVVEMGRNLFIKFHNLLVRVWRARASASAHTRSYMSMHADPS